MVVFTQHHSLTDAWSSNVIDSALVRAYSGYEVLKATPFKEHVQYCLSIDPVVAESFWSQHFQGYSYSPFQLLSQSAGAKAAKEAFGCLEFDSLRLLELNKKLGITTGSLIRLVWALALYKFSREDKIVFGALTSGRESGILGIERFAILLTKAPRDCWSTRFLSRSWSIHLNHVLSF